MIFPPASDPTAPYLSLPTLAAYLQSHGIEVLCIDANIGAYERFFTKSSLRRFGRRLIRRIKSLDGKKALNHFEQLIYAQLWKVSGYVKFVPDAIEEALDILRDRSGERFYDFCEYTQAIHTVKAAMNIISAAYSPFQMDFTSYRTLFSFLTSDIIRRDAEPDRNPFYDYFSNHLVDYVREEDIRLIGISAVFPGQLQPSYSLGYILRKALPKIHITIGGPAISQLLVRINPAGIASALGPFHSAVIFEGEEALLRLAHQIEKGEKITGIIQGDSVSDLCTLPAPDFDGMPLGSYLSPSLVLPYDPARGCYWSQCAFCHYGLSTQKTASYRERRVEQVVTHLSTLAKRYCTRIFYFSVDTLAPRFALEMSKEIIKRRLNIRWATDMRPERSLNAENCRKMAEGGALCLTFGIESASHRVLRRIDKGIQVHEMREAIENTASATIAVEVMCFTGFPTETYAEALETIHFINDLYAYISLFMCGEFELLHGSKVAAFPENYDIKKIWHVEGDQFLTGIFYEELKSWKTSEEKEKIDHAIDDLSHRWQLRRYPWAGSLSTAHTFLWYDRFGPEVFKKIAHSTKGARLALYNRPARFDISRIIKETGARETEIWETLVRKERKVTPALYRTLAKKQPLLFRRSK
ncbi:MAG: B12-binding domain-containing radical SAM protein [bacterium]